MYYIAAFWNCLQLWFRISSSVQSKTSWIHYVPLEYRKVALIGASTGESLKCTCSGSFLYGNYVLFILKNLPCNFQRQMSILSSVVVAFCINFRIFYLKNLALIVCVWRVRKNYRAPGMPAHDLSLVTPVSPWTESKKLSATFVVAAP